MVDLTFGECTAEILLSLSSTHSPLREMFFVSFFLSGSSVRGHACECADFDSGVVEPMKGFWLKSLVMFRQ